ncbi:MULTISPECIES: diadenosine tetraphosphate hydrolase [unclassified Bosea (in: a-proteobacteria)]|uniref:HIT family protein n=1 Tax=unclassified Bosea (in: a-proteobacteria) TaxID=2653178 RepID=UPI000F751424|nr:MULTISPECIES: diadenosine tetraphosphate hydrolase [unclassified Bosea (in: a-proteobacteria)]AZO76892.1 diadenosine tetraphosphate hydrolase [Bosea sp. Tri-49]RXT21730.1 diadenosine tetraphosphate hydrolase [Bosea sp. Tri-39]RXT32069.1 diadenosine tetraphosphate hydrolase [Bosea sp. Tri-54]
MSAACLSCEISSGRKAVLGGAICETGHFHAHQDVAYPVPALVIVASKRHFRSLLDMTAAETLEFLPLVQKIRRAQAQIGIEFVYYFYNEDTKHHFNFWMVPRYPWMASFGKSIEAVRPALLHARDTMNSEQELAAVTQAAAKLRESLRSR